MLKIINGRIASGKSRRIIEIIGEKMQTKQCLLIVPDQETYSFEKRLCRQLNMRGLIDVEVIAFNRLAARICGYTGGKRVFLDNCGKTMLLRACISHCRKDLTIFQTVAGTDGYIKKLERIFSIFENCGVTPQQLAEQSKNTAPSVLKSKLADLSLLYGEFSKLFNSGFTDNANLLYTAAADLSLFPLENTEIFIDGFDTLTLGLLNLVSAFMRRCDVTVSISAPLDGNDTDLYMLQCTMQNNLQQIAHENNIPIKVEKVQRPDLIKTPEIAVLECELYASPITPYNNKTENLAVALCKTPEKEVEFVAKRISSYVRSGEARYRDFCVLCKNPTDYEPYINKIFSALSLPFFTDTPQPVNAHPFTLYLFSSLSCAISGFIPETFCDYLLSGLTTLTERQADKLCSYIRRFGITACEIEHGLYSKRSNDDLQAEFNTLCNLATQPLIQLKNALNASETAAEKLTACFDFLKTQNLKQRLDKMLSEFESLELFDAADKGAQLWNITINLFDQYNKLLGSTTVSNDEFMSTLAAGFEASPTASIPSIIDCVFFGDISRSKENEVKHTFILGVADGIIPCVDDDGGVLTNAETGILGENGLSLVPDVTMLDAQQRYDIYSAFTSPSQSLTLSCACETASGSTVKPSYILSRIRKIFPKLSVLRYNSDNISEPLMPEMSVYELVSRRKTDPRAAALLEYMEQHGLCVEKIRMINTTFLPEKQLESELAKSLFSSTNAVSVSRIELFASCPYAHFFDYGLHPVEDRDFETDYLDTGNLLHATLDEFTKEFCKSEQPLSHDDCYRITREIFNKKLPTLHFGAMTASARRRRVNRCLCDIACQSTWSVATQLEHWKPLGSEIVFGNGKLPPIKVETDYGTLLLKGKIDRADTLEKDGTTFVRVIDYKSGSKDEYNPAGLETGESMQLYVYMNAILHTLGENAKPAGMYYFRLADQEDAAKPKISGVSLAGCDGLKKKEVSEEQFDDILKTAESKTKELVTDILSGYITPRVCKHCKNCSYSGLCDLKGIQTENEMD